MHGPSPLCWLFYTSSILTASPSYVCPSHKVLDLPLVHLKPWVTWLYWEMSKLTHSRLTSLDKLHALLFGHVLPEVSINVAVHVGAAGAAKCTRLSHTHPAQWNAVHLENNSASDTVITVPAFIQHKRTRYIQHFDTVSWATGRASSL